MPKCQHCGGEFAPKVPWQKYCDDPCRGKAEYERRSAKESYRAYHREYNRKYMLASYYKKKAYVSSLERLLAEFRARDL